MPARRSHAVVLRGHQREDASAQRRDASALLAGCHEPWRRQRPDHDLLTRPAWQRLLPLVAQVQHQRPDVALPAVLTDRVASARSLPGVLAWRLWRLLRQSRPLETQPKTSPRLLAASTPSTTVQEPEDWHQHLSVVRALGGPAAVRAALEENHPSYLYPPSYPYGRTGEQKQAATTDK